MNNIKGKIRVDIEKVKRDRGICVVETKSRYPRLKPWHLKQLKLRLT